MIDQGWSITPNFLQYGTQQVEGKRVEKKERKGARKKLERVIAKKI